MAKRNKEALAEEEKRKFSKENMKKLLGIFRFVLPYKGVFLVGLVALVLSTVTLLAFPFLSGQLFDVATGVQVEYFHSVKEVGITLLIILFAQSIFSFVRVYTFSIVTERSLADIRKYVYQKLIWQPMTFFDSNRVGELTSRITTDVSTLHATFSVTLAELFRQVLTLIIGTAIIFFFAPQLTGFMLLTLPVLVVVALIFGKFIRKLSKKTQDKLAEANVIVEESLQSVSIVKAFTNEWFEIKRFGSSIKDAANVAISTSQYRGLFISFIIFALIGAMVGVQWYGATLIQDGPMSSGGLYSFILYTIFIGGSIGGLGDTYSQLQRAIGASERLLEIINQSSEEESDEQPLELKGNIVFDNISFSYPTRSEVIVLKNLSFTIQAGEKVALVGPSGSGKSTIINLLMRFYPVESGGAIKIEGKNITEYPLGSFRKNLGIVPQEVILFGGTIQENIAYGKPGATETDIIDAARKANALEFIDRFPEGLKTIVGERGIKLSGGQRQRIAIARAILKDPAILILDEATSSLDAQSEVLVQEALEKLMEGRTTIIIAHRLSTIKQVDRILVIKDGQLAEKGSHLELAELNNGIYSNLLKLQLQ